MLAKSEAKPSSRTSSRAQKQQNSPSKSSKRPRIDDKATEAKIAKLRVAQSSVAGSQKDDPASPDNNITSSSTSSPEPNTQHTTRTTTRSNSLDSSNNDTPSQTQEDLPPPRRTSARRRVTVQPTATNTTPATNARESADSDNESENHAGSDEDDAHEEEVNSDKETNKKSKSNKRTYTSEAMKQRFENLDQQQIQIREGSHPQYIQLLEDIESKRSEKYGNAELRRKLAQGAITACYEADKKQANDQYYFGRVSIRREMLDQVQQKISALHTEYITLKFGQEYSLAKAKLIANWVPPERPTMINILFTAGLHCFGGEEIFFFSGFSSVNKLRTSQNFFFE
ncbi:hypothetical protein K450DRAFT_257277 [Umbelopsis ramanniana AG]|uniref:Uncharacterized protein n=1 Tax=Umbelopsis ramanniana AG TaxID=1314678 RepID=A0AAD5E3V9_UMBRA|nr:uncharacterized protein K450DRAFT_257277 [Umbelopsis ramanniana AG]KAI8576337.1 hypothetical protein K450DRAFT_257277 [Umbelopsis ramanniana AG]